MDTVDQGRKSIRRTLSSSNVNSANQIHDYIKAQQNACVDQVPILRRDVTKSSMILPEQYDEQTLKLCIDTTRLSILEQVNSLNWCSNCRSLSPLYVEEDGNSLLHSLSLYIFGVHDRKMVLRQLLYQRLFMETSKGHLRQRWMARNDPATGITWARVVETSSDKVCNNPQYKMTSIHIFAMANILARPIIVCCKEDSDRSQQVSDKVGGIYLPILRTTAECEKSPIILGYLEGHFVPLISSENLKNPLSRSLPSEDAYHCIPLVKNNLVNLTINFLLPGEELGGQPSDLRNSYLDVVNISHSEIAIDAAMLKFKTPPAFSIELMWSLQQISLNMNQSATDLSNLADVTDAPVLAIRSDSSEYVEMGGTEENIYESLIHCTVKACSNSASSLNNEGLCGECFDNMRQRGSNIDRSRNVNPDVVPKHTSSILITPKRGSFANRCSENNCQNEGQAHLGGKCVACFEQAFNKINIEMTSSYDRLNKANTQIVSNTEYDKLNNFDVQNSQVQPMDSEGYLCPASMVNLTSTPSVTNVSQSSKTAVGEKPLPLPRKGPMDSIHSKVLCKVAGCLNSIGIDGEHCNVHNPEMRQGQFKVCIMKGCNNTAEYNDKFLCMVCFQSQKHSLREHDVLNKPNMLASGNFDLQSLAQELPPIPNVQIPSTNVPRFSGQFNAPHTSNQNVPGNMSNRFGHPPGADFHSIPPIPQIPQIPQIPTGRPNVSGIAAGTTSVSGTGFAPPTAYGGFEGFDRALGSPSASLNWQKGGVSASNDTSLKCIHCDNHANPAKDGLCNECWKQKDVAVGRNQAEQKCITEDCKGLGSETFNYLCEECFKKQLKAMNIQKNEGNVGTNTMRNTYMDMTGCNQGIMSGRNFMQNDPSSPRMSGANNQSINNNNNNFGNDSNNNDNVADNKNFLGFEVIGGPLNSTIPQQQPPVNNNFSQNQHFGNSQFFQQQHGQPQHQYMNTSYQQDRTKFQEPNQSRDVAYTGSSDGRRKCHGLDCEFFGSEEFGGYCSACFLTITKKEAEREGVARTFAPPDVNVNLPRLNQTLPTPHITTSTTNQPQRCKTTYCQNYGSVQRMGFCNECFQTYGNMNK